MGAVMHIDRKFVSQVFVESHSPSGVREYSVDRRLFNRLVGQIARQRGKPGFSTPLERHSERQGGQQ